MSRRAGPHDPSESEVETAGCTNWFTVRDAEKSAGICTNTKCYSTAHPLPQPSPRGYPSLIFIPRTEHHWADVRPRVEEAVVSPGTISSSDLVRLDLSKIF